MPYFAYKGRNARGELVQGVLESASQGTLADQLLAGGVTPLDIRPGKDPSDRFGFGRLFEEKVGPIDVMLFSRQLYTLLKAGVPIVRALVGLRDSAVNPAFRRLLGEVRESLESGRELSMSMSRHPQVFSPFYLSMVRVGEMTGMMDEIFLRLFHHLEFEQFMRSQVKSALRYPTFVVIVMVVAILVINLFVIPPFAKVYKGFNAKLPFMTEMLIGFSNFVLATWPFLLAGLAAAVFGFRAWVATKSGRWQWDRLKLRIPIAGAIVQKATLARFARSFALAAKSGVPIVQAMGVVASTVDNVFIAGKVDKMRESIERGESVLRTAIASAVFTPVVLQMIAVGEESGALDDLMQEVADMYQRDVEYDLKNLGAQIEPILIVFLGVLVMILALGVFLPIWDLGAAAMRKGG